MKNDREADRLRALIEETVVDLIRGKQGFYRIEMLHSRHMLAFAAVMRGESGRANRAISALIAAVPPDWARQNARFADGSLAMPLELRLRSGRWEEALAAPEPNAIFPTARVDGWKPEPAPTPACLDPIRPGPGP